MTIQQFFQKAFVGGQWYVAYRKKGEERFSVIQTPPDVWIADPFLCSFENEHYLFVEVYECSKHKAAIGYYHFENGIPVYKGTVIEHAYHMSYPCVFLYQGTHYMIPESAANNTISLYRAEHFPEKWVKEKDLLTGKKYVDSTVVCTEDGLRLLSYKAANKGWKLAEFELDMETKELKECAYTAFSENVGRPAGLLFDGNKRPAQDCSRKYGEALIVYQVDSFQPYKEHKLKTITAQQIKTDLEFDRVHTYNEDGMYEVIDLLREKMDLLHGIKIFNRTFMKKEFR